jgi:hypothetical protein
MILPLFNEESLQRFSLSSPSLEKNRATYALSIRSSYSFSNGIAQLYCGQIYYIWKLSLSLSLVKHTRAKREEE